MIPRAPSLFHIEEEGVAAAATTVPASAGELVGLRLIIQPSPRQRRPPLAVLRRSAVRPLPAAAAAATSSAAGSSEQDGRGFMGLGFLNCCYCCHKKLGADMDVFVYKGEQAFCSAECRWQQMAREERREIEMLVRRRRDAFHRRRAAPPKIGGSPDHRHARLQIAAS